MAETLIDFLIPVALMNSAFVLVFIFCELGERLTHRFNRIDNEVLCLSWYMYPLKVKKILPMIVAGTQEPFILTGFGNVPCTRAAFKSV